MQDYIFARVECKYNVSRYQYEELLDRLKPYMSKDEYFQYKVCSIYYDTDNYDLLRISGDKPVYKEKLRLRSYRMSDGDSEIYIEIKKKYDGIVYKRRIAMPPEEAYQFIREPKGMTDTMNEREIRTFLNRYQLYPKVYLSYDRQAYHLNEDNDCRITFDSNIRYRMDNLNFESEDEGVALEGEPDFLMEVKSLHAVPLHMARLLSELKIYPVSHSKVGKVYQNHILKGVER